MARGSGATKARSTVSRRHASGVLLVGGALALLHGCVRPAERAMEFAPIAMHPAGPYTATPDGAVTFSGEGSLHLDLYMRAGRLTVTVLAAGVPEGAPARLGVALGDGPAEAVAVGQQGEATAHLPIERAGMHVLRVRVDSPVRIRRIFVLSGG